MNSRPAPFSREPFDISPHRGESPFTREPKQSLSLLTSFVASSWREPVPFVTTWHFPTPWGITLYKGAFWHFTTLWGITLFDVAWKRLQCKFGSWKRHLCKKSAIFCRNFEISADWRIINTLIIYFDGVIINILCSCSFTPHRCIRHFFKFEAV